jgi:cell division protein FtsB
MRAMRPSRVMVVLLLVLAALLAFLQWRLWFGHGGAGEVQDLSSQVERQARDNGGLRQRNAEVAAEVEDLKSGEAAVEERARSELGMIKPGETFYRVVEPASGSTTTSDEDAETTAPETTP